MKHIFQNEDGELVAADTAEQASKYYDGELGGSTLPIEGDAVGWIQILDTATIPTMDYEMGVMKKRLAKAWAAEFSSPACVATTYG